MATSAIAASIGTSSRAASPTRSASPTPGKAPPGTRRVKVGTQNERLVLKGFNNQERIDAINAAGLTSDAPADVDGFQADMDGVLPEEGGGGGEGGEGGTKVEGRGSPKLQMHTRGSKSAGADQFDKFKRFEEVCGTYRTDRRWQ